MEVVIGLDARSRGGRFKNVYLSRALCNDVSILMSALILHIAKIGAAERKEKIMHKAEPRR